MFLHLVRLTARRLHGISEWRSLCGGGCCGVDDFVTVLKSLFAVMFETSFFLSLCVISLWELQLFLLSQSEQISAYSHFKKHMLVKSFRILCVFYLLMVVNCIMGC